MNTKRTNRGYFDVVRRNGGLVTVEFLSEHIDEYTVRHFRELAADAADAVRIAESMEQEANHGG